MEMKDKSPNVEKKWVWCPHVEDTACQYKDCKRCEHGR